MSDMKLKNRSEGSPEPTSNSLIFDKLTDLFIPPQMASLRVSDLSRDELLQLLEANNEGGIRIAFAGKDNARRLARIVRPRVLRMVPKYSVGPLDERAANMAIEGDNLQAMATLYKERGHVDLILADPPYNTGKDFRYNDKWDEDPNDSGLGEIVSADDGARHTKWMRFMWPRLQMMKQMLRPNGVLAICIDHRELFHLGQMLDELFGAQNRIAIINWEKAASKRNDAEHVSTATEYVLVYAKDKDKARTGLLDRTEDHDANYQNPDNDSEGDWYGVAPWGPSRDTHMGMVYAVQSPFTGELHYPPGSRCWGFEKPTIKKWLEEWGAKYEERDLHDGFVPALLLKGAKDPRKLADKIKDDPVVAKASRAAFARRERQNWPMLVFTKGGLGKPRKKTHLKAVKKGIVPSTFWSDEDYFEPAGIGCTSWSSDQSGTSEAGARELSAILGDDHGFETVKPIKLFEKIIQLWCPADGLVLDPFAGSGTTGHAVLAQNARSKATRRFVLIEQGRPENGDSYARSLLAERLRRVVEGDWINNKGKPIRGGFSFLSLGKKVDAAVLLRMEREEMVDTVIASHFDATRRRGDQLVRIEESSVRSYRYLVAKNSDNEGFFLIWDGAGKNTNFTEEVYEMCAKEAASAKLHPMRYHVYARLYRYQTEGVRFYQIPDRILADFGLDLKSEPLNESC
ncbi:site-specific DNA-methyltransferase [Bradyrhizobium manausense]|uniref:site-specific DNA-methyltransferase n=1 Tax=Bradyrhizobium manausense TaxID=989370 RepID=UPI00201227BF|nr:site-specific DNA-methyltransferase [Bradyrhizobium manausense]